MGLTTSPEGRDGLLRGLEQALKTSGALRAQFASLLAKQLHVQPGGGATPRRLSNSKKPVTLLTEGPACGQPLGLRMKKMLFLGEYRGLC